MPDLHTNFAVALRAAIVAAWPDVLPGAGGGGVIETEDAARVAYEQIPLPAAILVVPEFETSEEFQPLGVEDCLQGYALVYYVGTKSTTVAQIRQKFDDLTVYLDANGLSSGQVLMRTTVSTSRDLEPNAIFIGKAMPNRCGMIGLECIYGEI